MSYFRFAVLGLFLCFSAPPAREIDKIANAGFRFVRMDMSWPAVEKKKGEYDFSQYDLLVKALE